MDTQQLLGDAGAPFQFEWRGKKFTVRFKTQRLKAEIEKYVKEESIRELTALKSLMDKEDYDKRMGKLIDDITNDRFSVSKERCQQMMNTTKGSLEMMRIYLGPEGRALSDDELMELMDEKKDEIEAFIISCTGKLEGIKRDLNWDEEKDPEGITIDKKKLRTALRQAGLL